MFIYYFSDYILGYDFTESIILITKNNFYFYVGPKKGKYLYFIVIKQ